MKNESYQIKNIKNSFKLRVYFMMMQSKNYCVSQDKTHDKNFHGGMTKHFTHLPLKAALPRHGRAKRLLPSQRTLWNGYIHLAGRVRLGGETPCDCEAVPSYSTDLLGRPSVHWKIVRVSI